MPIKTDEALENVQKLKTDITALIHANCELIKKQQADADRIKHITQKSAAAIEKAEGLIRVLKADLNKAEAWTLKLLQEHFELSEYDALDLMGSPLTPGNNTFDGGWPGISQPGKLAKY